MNVLAGSIEIAAALLWAGCAGRDVEKNDATGALVASGIALFFGVLGVLILLAGAR